MANRNERGNNMKEKLFLIKKSNNYPLEKLKKKSIPELTVKADYALESFSSFSTLVTEGIINLSEYHLVPKQVQEEEHHVQVGKNDDWIDIVINNELQLHVSTNSGECYNIDLYAYNADVSDNDKDWGADFITSAYASYEELKEIKEKTEE